MKGAARPIHLLVVDATTPRTLRLATPFRTIIRRLFSITRNALPRGRTLPRGAWCQRHRTLAALLWLHALALPAFGIVRGYGVLHSLSEGMALAVIAGLAHLAAGRPRLASAVVSFGLVSSSAILVHLSGGVIEAHFHFFVVIVLLTLYEDWMPFLLAAAYVVLHHGVMGAIEPASVYNHPDALAHPWKWASIHAGFVAAAGIASIAAWRLNEAVRAETRQAYRQAHESEQRFRSAFDEAPIGIGLASIVPGSAGRFLRVNRAMTELLGYTQDEFTTLAFGDITHPDDLEQSVASFARIAAGETADLDLEKRYIRADGKVIWGLLHISLVRDGSGDPLYAIGQIQDITERKAAREQLARQALEDQLTGLGNRRKLLMDLKRVLAEPTKQETRLLLFDLDGFKVYNDTFGHPAGDALLTRFGRRLEGTVEGRGWAYRMGGDEFCVLAAAGPEGSADLTEAAVAALREHGDGFAITASHGSVLLPTEAKNVGEALGKADQRMYEHKSLSRSSAQDQITQALVTAVDERSSRLRTHLGAVADLCDAVGTKLGLPRAELIALRQGASLHDIGKIAVPDAILSKPAPLSPDEWELVSRHTLIGERIVAAAPGLRSAAKLIRSSHERYDGRGYPDQLAGEDIPLGARIIAVCDAYDGMTSDRPYGDRLTPDAALEEIRRCAGSQFDPVVVEAFCAAHAEFTWEHVGNARRSAL
jgi:diguanylate cyclase (GGDEF)-like protein/PAS domain S-box-containing protein